MVAYIVGGESQRVHWRKVRHDITSTASREGCRLKSVRAIVIGLFAEIVAISAFYGVAQAGPAPGRLLAFLFLITLALIGAVSTWFARRQATPGAGKGIAMLVSGAIFAVLILLLWASVESLQDG